MSVERRRREQKRRCPGNTGVFNHTKQLGNCLCHGKQSETGQALSCCVTSEQQLETPIRQSFVDARKEQGWWGRCTVCNMMWEKVFFGSAIQKTI